MAEIELLKFANGFLGLGVALWVMYLGDKRMTQLYTDYRASMESIVKDVQAQNRALQETLITCISAIQSGKPCKDTDD